MNTHLTPENQQALIDLKHKLKKKEKANRAIQSAKEKQAHSHDNYGFFDIFKSKEKRYEDACGLSPVQKSTESPADYAKRVDAYKNCIATEQAKFETETNQKTESVGQSAANAQNWFQNIFGGKPSDQPLYQDGGTAIYPDSGESSEKIMGMPKVAFYVLLLLVITLVVYLLFFKNKGSKS